MTDEAQDQPEETRATGENVTVGDSELPEWRSELNYTVPKEGLNEGQEKMAGTKVTVEFKYPRVSSDGEAQAVMTSKGWSLIEDVNEKLKGLSRSSAYQSTAAIYKKAKSTPEQIREAAIRNLIKSGVPEEMARGLVLGAIESAANAAAE